VRLLVRSLRTSSLKDRGCSCEFETPSMVSILDLPIRSERPGMLV
jgi:hypothetical protein